MVIRWGLRLAFPRRSCALPSGAVSPEEKLRFRMTALLSRCNYFGPKAQRVHSPQMEVQLASLLCLRPLLYRNEPFHGGGELKAYAYWRLDERCELFMNDI